MKLSTINFDANFTANKCKRSKPTDQDSYGNGYNLGFFQGILSERPKNGTKGDHIDSRMLHKIAKAYGGDPSKFRRGYMQGHKTGSEAARKRLDIEA